MIMVNHVACRTYTFNTHGSDDDGATAAAGVHMVSRNCVFHLQWKIALQLKLALFFGEPHFRNDC